MKVENSNRTRRITLRLTVQEFQLIESRFKSTTSHKLSDYIRKLILERKVTVLTRNQSVDDFLTEAVLLRRKLNAIGNNHNQIVKKLNAARDIPEILSYYLESRMQFRELSEKTEEIKSAINILCDRWLHE